MSRGLLVCTSSRRVYRGRGPIIFVLYRVFFGLFLRVIFQYRVYISNYSLVRFSGSRLYYVAGTKNRFSVYNSRGLFRLMFAPSMLFPFNCMPGLCIRAVTSGLNYMGELYAWPVVMADSGS